MTHPNDALEAFNRILRLTAYSDVSRGIDDEDIDLIRAALTQKPPVIEGLDEALSRVDDDDGNVWIQDIPIFVKAARAYQQGHTQPQESVDVDDTEGFLFVLSIANQTGNEHWHDEFIDFYKPEKWLSSRRAACSFLSQKIASATHNITKKG